MEKWDELVQKIRAIAPNCKVETQASVLHAGAFMILLTSRNDVKFPDVETLQNMVDKAGLTVVNRSAGWSSLKPYSTAIWVK